jgi:drug/metabolite transporter (DMT)-like permease
MWAATTLTIKRTSLARISAEKVLVYQLAVSAPVLIAVSPLFGPVLRQPGALPVAALLYQGVVVVALSYPVWFWLLRSYPAGQLSTFVSLTPVVAVVLGGLILGEPLSWRLAAALALVAGGIHLVTERRRGAEVPVPAAPRRRP